MVFAAPSGRKTVAKVLATSCFDGMSSERRTRAAPNDVWIVPGSQLGVQDGQHGGQDDQLGGQDGPTCRPEAVPSAFPRDLGATQNDPERPETAETSFSSIFHRFWSIFRRFFVDFSHSEVKVRTVLASIFFRICRAIFTR